MSEAFPGASKIVQGQLGNCVCLRIGPPGAGKSMFAKQFIWDGLREGTPAIYVVTDEPPDFTSESMKGLGFDVKPFLEKEQLVIVDCYSPRSGLPPTSKYSANSETMSDVSITIEEARRNFPKSRVVIDSVTSLVMDAPPSSGQKFMQVVSARVRGSSTGVVIMEAGVPDPNFMSFFRFLFDGVFEMKIQESESGLQRYFRVFSLKGANHSSAWVPYNISDKGVAIG